MIGVNITWMVAGRMLLIAARERRGERERRAMAAILMLRDEIKSEKYYISYYEREWVTCNVVCHFSFSILSIEQLTRCPQNHWWFKSEISGSYSEYHNQWWTLLCTWCCQGGKVGYDFSVFIIIHETCQFWDRSVLLKRFDIWEKITNRWFWGVVSWVASLGCSNAQWTTEHLKAAGHGC